MTATDGPVTATAATPDEGAQFDVFGWGQGVVTLRNVETSHVLGYEGGAFITRDAQPSGWFVPQQFKLEAQPGGSVVLRYAGYDSLESWFGDKVYATVGDDGKLTLGASTPADAAHFEKTTLRDGQQEAVDAARGADAAVVVVGSMPFINGREAHDRTTMALAESQEALVKAVLAANPNTVVVVENSYPDTLTWEQDNVPAILWTTHAGQETGHALADVLFGDVNPAGRADPDLVPLGRRPAGHPRLRRHRLGPHVPVLPRHAAVRVRPRPQLHALPLRRRAAGARQRRARRHACARG